MNTKSMWRMRFGVCLLALAAFCYIPTMIALAAEEITSWTIKAPMLSPTGGRVAAVGPNGNIYVFGGTSDNFTYIDLNQEYDPIADSWALKSPLPSGPRDGGGAATVQGKIYVIGGHYWGTYLSVNEAYDPSADNWVTKTPMSAARDNFGIGVTDNGKIYVVGGQTGPGCDWSFVNTMEVYDPTTDTWAPGPPMPTIRTALSAVVVKGKLYAIGGLANDCMNHHLAVVEAYDPMTGQWTQRASMNEGRAWPAAVVAGDGYIYVAGGSTSDYPTTDTVEQYNPDTDTWTYVASMPYKSSSLAVASVVPGAFYVFGGYTPDTSTKINTVAQATIAPVFLEVAIDIKPGSFPNSINLGSGGTVPVAILSTSTFDATKVDPLTVTLASAPVKLKGKGKPMASFEDVSGDNLLDLVVHVDTTALQLSETDTLANLEGKTFDGIEIRGSDSVRVVP